MRMTAASVMSSQSHQCCTAQGGRGALPGAIVTDIVGTQTVPMRRADGTQNWHASPSYKGWHWQVRGAVRQTPLPPHGCTKCPIWRLQRRHPPMHQTRCCTIMTGRQRLHWSALQVLCHSQAVPLLDSSLHWFRFQLAPGAQIRDRGLTWSGSPTSSEPGVGQEAPIESGQSRSQVVGSTGAPSTLSSSATHVRSPQFTTFWTESTAIMSRRVDVKKGGRKAAAT
jgi:hypothetical protein